MGCPETSVTPTSTGAIQHPRRRPQLDRGGTLKCRRCSVNPTYNVGLKFGSSSLNSQALHSEFLPPELQVPHQVATMGSPIRDEYLCPCLQLRERNYGDWILGC